METSVSQGSQRALRLTLSVKELMNEFDQYFEARVKVDSTYPGINTEERQRRIGQVIYDQPGGLLAKEVRLSYIGLSLADFLPEGYNDSKLPETATGK